MGDANLRRQRVGGRLGTRETIAERRRWNTNLYGRLESTIGVARMYCNCFYHDHFQSGPDEPELELSPHLMENVYGPRPLEADAWRDVQLAAANETSRRQMCAILGVSYTPAPLDQAATEDL